MLIGDKLQINWINLGRSVVHKNVQHNKVHADSDLLLDISLF